MLNNLVGVNGVGFLVRDVHVIATGQPYPRHNLCHGQHPMVAWLSTDVAVTALGPPAERAVHSRPTERPVAWDVPRAQSHVNMAVPWTYASRHRNAFERSGLA